MPEIKPAEITNILREQLGGFKTESELQEVGTVLQVGDGIARIYGLNNVQYGELIEFETGLQSIALNLEEDNVGVVLLGSSNDIKEALKKAEEIGKKSISIKYLGAGSYNIIINAKEYKGAEKLLKEASEKAIEHVMEHNGEGEFTRVET